MRRGGDRGGRRDRTLDIGGHVVVILGKRQELFAQRAVRGSAGAGAQLFGGFAQVAGFQHAPVRHRQPSPIRTRRTVLTSSALLTGLRSTALAPRERAVLR